MSVSKKKAKLYYCASLTAPYLRFSGGFLLLLFWIKYTKLERSQLMKPFLIFFFCFVFVTSKCVWVQIHSVCLKWNEKFWISWEAFIFLIGYLVQGVALLCVLLPGWIWWNHLCYLFYELSAIILNIPGFITFAVPAFVLTLIITEKWTELTDRWPL